MSLERRRPEQEMGSMSLERRRPEQEVRGCHSDGGARNRRFNPLVTYPVSGHLYRKLSVNLDSSSSSGEDRSEIFTVKLPAKTRSTLKDVAREANVSQSTVSYVLNNNKHAARITEATKQRVHEVVRRLGYQFNPIGRALQRGYTNQVILLIVTWDLATSHSATAMAISRAAIAQGFELTVHVADNDSEAEAFLKRGMLHNIGGLLVLWDSPAMRVSYLGQLCAEGVPVVDLLPNSPRGMSTVTPDREDAFDRGTSHLIEFGHRRIALISDSLTRPKTTLSKISGYKRALKKAGLKFDESLVLNVTEFGFEGGLSSFPSLARLSPKATAAICINDAIALGVITAAGDAGWCCPKDFSVVGFGDSPMGKYWRPALTTFALSANRVADLSVSLIFQQRQDRTPKARAILVPEELIVRESTGPVSSP